MEVKLDLRMTPRISAGGRKERPFGPCLILDSNTDVVVGSDMKVEVVEFLYRRGNIIALGLKSCSPASILFLPPKFPMNSDRHEIVFNSLTVATFVPRELGVFGRL